MPKSVGQNKYSLCKFANTNTKVAGVDNWSIQISPAKVDIGVKLQKKTAINFCSFDNMRLPIHPCHRLDLHNQLLFWMCGFAWVILPAMTSGVMVAEEVALLWILPHPVLSILVLVVLKNHVNKTGICLFTKHKRADLMISALLLH